MLVLDMYDPAAKQLVWRGKASKTLDENAKPDKRQKNLAKGVEEAAEELSAEEEVVERGLMYEWLAECESPTRLTSPGNEDTGR